MLIILSGPSGVGKGTVREELFKDESLNLAYSISMTTRRPRPAEKDGIDYFFVEEDEFKKKIDEDKLYYQGKRYLKKKTIGLRLEAPLKIMLINCLMREKM